MCLFFSPLWGRAPLPTLKMCGGLSWINGGDFNKNIRGWRDYYKDRNSSPYSFQHNVGDLLSLWESRAELIFNFSSRLSLGIGVEFLAKRISGEMSWNFSQNESYFNSPKSFGEISIEEESFQTPQYTIQSLPVIISFYYSFPLGKKWILSLEGGGGYYFGLLRYREEYQYSFDYVHENTSDCCVVTDVDQYTSSGEYSEESRSHSLGFHGGGSLEIRLASRFSLIVEVLGRWVNFKGWKGTRVDKYTWEHTWGLFGTNFDSGSNEETRDGKLWIVDFQSDETGNSYPRFIFSEEEPVSLVFRNMREGKINFNGLSLRIGFMIHL